MLTVFVAWKCVLCGQLQKCNIGVRRGGKMAGRIVGWLTLVLSRRRMNWKFVFSPETSDIVAVDGRCYCLSARTFSRRRSCENLVWVQARIDAKPALITQTVQILLAPPHQLHIASTVPPLYSFGLSLSLSCLIASPYRINILHLSRRKELMLARINVHFVLYSYVCVIRDMLQLLF